MKIKDAFVIGAIGLCGFGCTETVINEAIPPSTTTPNTLSEETSTACVRVGPSSEDPLISNLIELGIDMQYIGDSWYMNGREVGKAWTEDGAFVFCDARTRMEIVINEREKIDG